MNFRKAIEKKDQYDFLKGYVIKQIDAGENELFPIAKVIIAPKNLLDFNLDFDTYYHNLDSRNLPMNIDYDIYLCNDYRNAEDFVRLEEAIMDYNVITTYEQHVKYLYGLYDRAYQEFENARLKLEKESSTTTTAFLDKKLHDDVFMFDAHRKELYDKAAAFELHVNEHIHNPQAELITGLKMDNFFNKEN